MRKPGEAGHIPRPWLTRIFADTLDFSGHSGQVTSMRVVSLIYVTIILLLAGGLQWASFSYFKAQEIDKAAARLTLYRSALESELRHFAHLPFLLTLDPVVARVVAGAAPEELDHRLARFAQSAGLDAIYLMDSDGLTISASNAKSPDSFKGQSYGFRPYFQDAQNGELGEFYGIGATTGIPGYFYAMQVRPPQTEATGVIAIKIDLSRLQEGWETSGERIILANEDGVVLLASRPEWRYKTFAPLSEGQRSRIIASKQFGTEPLEALDWSLDLPRRSARIGDESLMYLSTSNLPNSWSLHFFVPSDQAATRAWLTTGAFLALVLMSFSAFQVARNRRIRQALRASEREEAQLRRANERLAVEIEERRTAERTLKKTQAELERAGRLAALGQLASSVTHELGQPIAAMRNQLAASEMTVGPSTLNEKMQSLVARMENITRQLKFFSRKGRDSLETFDLNDAVRDALDLLKPSVTASGADLQVCPAPAPLHLVANRLRIEQVITNLVRNALDAVETSEVKQVIVTSGGSDTEVWLTVVDTGHGLGEKTLDDLKEPFATTRESGRGMGLGLTISAGIVSDHNGRIDAQTRPEGGAVFHVCLPRSAADMS